MKNIQEFAKQFGKQYNVLYDADVQGIPVEGRAGMASLFDRLMKENEKFKTDVQEFCQYRQDFLVSDRECAAFTMVWNRNKEVA